MRPMIVVALAATLAGCRAAPSPPDEAGTALAQPPLLRSPATRSDGPPTGTPVPGGSSPAASTGATPAQARSFERIGIATDARGDGGAGTPAYGDLRAVAIEDDGTSARVSARLFAAVPNPMPREEQMAVGIDLYAAARAPESDYQVFAAGTDEGWLAYLHAPEGIVPYPGTFEIAGDVLVFTVPWSSLGDLRGSRFSSFCDWDKEEGILNLAGQDKAPDSGRARFSR